MAKDRTRERKLPSWLEQRQTRTVRTTEEISAYYGSLHPDLVGWHDGYGAFVRGARVKQ